MFASTSIAAHLTRGIVGAALIAWAVFHQSSNSALAVIAIVLALVAMRGCPMCWALGLVATIGNRMRPFVG